MDAKSKAIAPQRRREAQRQRRRFAWLNLGVVLRLCGVMVFRITSLVFIATLIAPPAHTQTPLPVPTPIKVPDPIEPPSLPNRPVQLFVAGHTFTIERATELFLKQNLDLQAARELLAQVRATHNQPTEVTDPAVIKAEYELADVTRRGLLELKRAFYEAVLARLLQYEAQDNLTFLDNYISRWQARYEESIAPESEARKWRLERARVEDAIAELKLSERLARIKFFNLLGLTNSINYPALLIYFDQAPAASLDYKLEALLEVGLSARPDLLSAKLATRIATSASEARVRSDKRENKQTAQSNPVNDQFTLHTAQLAEQQLHNRIYAEIEAAYAAVETHRQRALAIQSRQWAEVEYLRGVAASYYNEYETQLITLLEAQRTRWEVRQQYQRALCAYYVSLAELEAATGMQLKEIKP